MRAGLSVRAGHRAGGRPIDPGTGHAVPSRPAASLRLGRALRFVWESGPGWTLASGSLLLVQGLMPLVTLYLMKQVVDAVGSGIGAADPTAAFRHVAFYVALAGAVAVANATIEAVAAFVHEGHSLAVTDHMQNLLHAKAVEIDLEYYENTEYQNTLHRAQQEAPVRPTRILRSLIQLGQNGISLIGIAVLLVVLHWGVAVVLLITALPALLVRSAHARELYRWQRGRTAKDRQAQYLNLILTGPAFARELRIFDLGAPFSQRSHAIRRVLRDERLRMSRRRSTRELLTQVAAILPVYVAYGFIAYRTVIGVITLGSLVMYFQAFQRGQSALNGLTNGLTSLYEDNLFIVNLYEFLDLRPKVTAPARPKAIPAPMRTGVVFDRVSFRYPNAERAALEDVSLTLRPDEVVAIVGSNGSGKTTLVKLLCRLYDPTKGRVTLDGVDLREYRPEDVRRQISVMFQDHVRYNLTVRENIWLGDTGLERDDARVEVAARDAGADDVISRLRNGYDQMLGTFVEQGDELSIGEWQKIALARAFLRNAPITILDEPTSALDPEAEAEVFDRLRQILNGRAAILISHRLSTVRAADRIYVLDRGRVVETGTHDELVRRGNAYSALFEAQARHYR